MLKWHLILILQKIYLIDTVLNTVVEGNILQSVFGVPTECIYHNIVRQCKLSFACWLEGGKYAHGCGENKWLYSCCILENDLSIVQSAVQLTSKYPTLIYRQKQHKSIPTSTTIGNVKFQNLNTKSTNKNKLLKKHYFKNRRNDENILMQECGIPRKLENSLQKRIIGGRPANFGEYPWQVHIRIAEYQCGGVLVSHNFIATAAHCIQRANLRDITIYLGELDTQNLGVVTEPLPSERYRIKRKIIHPKFKFRITQPDRYDIALLQLVKSVGYKEHILPICLPKTPVKNLIGHEAIIAGWGKTELNLRHTTTGTNILHSANVPIIGTDECIQWHESKQIYVEIYDEMFCAGHPNGLQDACLGDSGGPLIIFENDHFTLIGITSAGFGCGIDHQPGIYHNVQKTTKWIENIINNN